MKRILFAAAAAATVALAAPALAAPASPAVDWTGLYLGAHTGFGFASEDWAQTYSSLALALDSSVKPVKPEGVLAGVQAGYDFQSGPWVFGVGGDWSWTDQRARADHVVFTSYGGDSKLDWTATATGRVGYAVSQSLIYVNAGGAFAGEKSFITFNGDRVTDIRSGTRTGWTAGGGVETKLTNHWSAALEYSYADYGKDKFIYTYNAHPAGLIEDWNLKTTDQAVKLRINYRFGAF